MDVIFFFTHHESSVKFLHHLRLSCLTVYCFGRSEIRCLGINGKISASDDHSTANRLLGASVPNSHDNRIPHLISIPLFSFLFFPIFLPIPNVAIQCLFQISFSLLVCLQTSLWLLFSIYFHVFANFNCNEGRCYSLDFCSPLLEEGLKLNAMCLHVYTFFW